MKVYIDGLEIRGASEIKILKEDFKPVEGISPESTLELCLEDNGMQINLIECTERSCPSAEDTYEEWFDWEQLVEALKKS